MDFGYIGSFSGVMQEVTLDIDGVRIVLTHGHLRNVRAGLENIAYLAEEKRAQLVLYGHTHIPYCRHLVSTDKGGDADEIILFNPGSIGKTYGEAAPSFGILEVREGKISIRHGKVVL
jgi:putative phosphoesterase